MLNYLQCYCYLCYMFCRNRIDDIGTENMNPEDIYNSIKQTSADIQNLSLWDGSGRYEHTKKDVIQVPAVMIGNRRRSSGDSGGPSELKDTSLMHRFLYDPSQYQEKVCNLVSVNSIIT